MNKIFKMRKSRDDMRQDALELTTIRFIDDNLKRFNIDMQLTPYSVVPISKVLEQTNGNLEEFFRADCSKECRDRFIKS